MLDNFDRITLLVHGPAGLQVPMEELLSGPNYQKYRDLTVRLLASGGDPLDAIGSDEDSNFRRHAYRAALLIRVMMDDRILEDT